MVTLKSCPICGSQNIAGYHQVFFGPELLYEIMPGAKINVAIFNRYSICRNCFVIFQNPRLSEADLDRYYGQGYYRLMDCGDKEEKYQFEANRAKIDAEIIKRRIGQPASHLDIGCSRGYLLKIIGGKVKVGVEPNVGYVTAKDVEVYSKINQVPRKLFDLVTAIHVLEHAPYPLDYLQKMAKFIGKKGQMVIEVPTKNSPNEGLDFSHLYRFETEVLKKICARAGLRVIHAELTPHLLLICKADK